MKNPRNGRRELYRLISPERPNVLEAHSRQPGTHESRRTPCSLDLRGARQRPTHLPKTPVKCYVPEFFLCGRRPARPRSSMWISTTVESFEGTIKKVLPFPWGRPNGTMRFDANRTGAKPTTCSGRQTNPPAEDPRRSLPAPHRFPYFTASSP